MENETMAKVPAPQYIGVKVVHAYPIKKERELRESKDLAKKRQFLLGLIVFGHWLDQQRVARIQKWLPKGNRQKGGFCDSEHLYCPRHFRKKVIA